jgi:hypothetical protein
MHIIFLSGCIFLGIFHIFFMKFAPQTVRELQSLGYITHCVSPCVTQVVLVHVLCTPTVFDNVSHRLCVTAFYTGSISSYVAHRLGH